MTRDTTRHYARIMEWLARMQHKTYGVLDYELLQSGASGTCTYRLDLGTELVILKVASAGDKPYVLQRAQREVAFYRDLAQHIPLTVPRTLATYTDTTSGIGILLEAYREPHAPQHWTTPQYLEVAEQLACFHSAFWGSTEQLSRFHWLRHIGYDDTPMLIQQAYHAWSVLFAQERFADIFTPRYIHLINESLEQTVALGASTASFPTTLCHGDCHIGNLLHNSENGLVWADWQEVGIGRGPEDVSFFLQRAEAAGGAIPCADVTAAYHKRLQAGLGERIPLATIWHIMTIYELWTRLLHWPAYLGQAPEAQVLGHVQRIEYLVQGLRRSR